MDTWVAVVFTVSTVHKTVFFDTRSNPRAGFTTLYTNEWLNSELDGSKGNWSGDSLGYDAR